MWLYKESFLKSELPITTTYFDGGYTECPYKTTTCL